MDNRWSDRDAEAAIERYTKQGATLDVALAVYATRLLGSEPRLVLHGGGNTSVKTRMPVLGGETIDVLCVKGSGWDMASIEPAGLPAVRLAPLRALADLDVLSDAEMVNAQRCALLDADAPNPSIETLLHAFLPQKYVFHTHANAVLALTDQRGGEQLCREVYGESMALVPYCMPGFVLAKAALAAWRENPDVDGLVLLNHGIFTFGETAKQAYERMIEHVSQAEERSAAAARVHVAGVALPKAVGRSRPKSFQPARLPERLAPPTDVIPIVRGLLAIDRGGGDPLRWILEFRSSPQILDFVGGTDLARYAQEGPPTPDHVIRTKAKPLLLPPAEAGHLEAFAEQARAAVAAYHQAYQEYFERNNARVGGSRQPLDPAPRVVLIPGLGLLGAGADRAAAHVAADLAEACVDVVAAAEAIGRYQVLGEADLFDIEYWSLEQAKLGKAAEKPLARRVAVITGAGSGIGAATARAFRDEGAEVALLDIDAGKAEAAARPLGGVAIACDVTRADSVRAAFNRVIEAYGGVDIVVSNAGAAWQGRIGEVDESMLRQSFELNFWAHQKVASTAVRVLRAQGTGGCLLFNASKQAIDPGPGFGPYGLPKAATLALMRQYAIDYGRDGIRACAVNADRIRSGLLTEQLIAERARARGVSEAQYMAGNLLGREVSADDVGRAFVHLALSASTTGAVLTVDGGNIAAAPR
jgi:rhamnose utilization protein RhaD (predicted bifunctional aldolase and dehydrogenase)/NAD(P)-dependent dehydrogenase (short-subunit alcohol dehydrogenase family)